MDGSLIMALAVVACALAFLYTRQAKGASPKAPAAANDPVLLDFGGGDDFRLSHAYQGVLGIGETGSGKTSSFDHLLLALMKLDRPELGGRVGLLLLPPKVGDCDHYLKLAKAAGREGDVIRVAPGQPWVFSPVQHEIDSPGGSVSSAGQFLQDLVDYASRGGSRRSSQPFFPMEAGRQLHMAMVGLHAAFGKVDVAQLYQFTADLPRSAEEYDSEKWRAGFCFQTMLRALQRVGEDPDFALAADFVRDWARLAPETSSSVLAHSQQVLSRLMNGDVRRLVTGESTVTPEDVLRHGKVIIVDTPYLKYREPGQLIQVIWKLALQRAALRRDVRENPRPVALVADEAQQVCVQRADNLTAAVARSHRLISINLTQSLDLVQTVLGSREETLAFVSNMATKFIYSNSDPFTNDWASALCGRTRHLMMSGGLPAEPYSIVDGFLGRAPQSGVSFSEQVHPDVLPAYFASRMRKGGVENGRIVDAICVQGGRVWSNNKPFLPVSFRQGVV